MNTQCIKIRVNTVGASKNCVLFYKQKEQLKKAQMPHVIANLEKDLDMDGPIIQRGEY